jgi:ParB family chromosome partitioning protein
VQKKGLGKGLGALIPGAEEARQPSGLTVELQRITANPLQPRRVFDETKLEELATSIRDQGVIQPLIVRRNGDGYELIAGERRLRAAMKAGLKEVPVVVREASDNDSLELALIENLQREDLNPIEEADAYRHLHEEFHLTQEEVAEKVGKSRPAVANSMRLLLLPKEMQQDVAQGRLAAGQARALLALGNEAMMTAVARRVIAKGLSTRETERLVARLKLGRRGRRLVAALDPDLRAVVEKLQRALGSKVRLVQGKRSGRGRLEIEYYSLDDLDRLIGILNQPQATSPGV